MLINNKHQQLNFLREVMFFDNYGNGIKEENDLFLRKKSSVLSAMRK